MGEEKPQPEPRTLPNTTVGMAIGASVGVGVLALGAGIVALIKALNNRRR
jgi:hypothetical protein